MKNFLGYFRRRVAFSWVVTMVLAMSGGACARFADHQIRAVWTERGEPPSSIAPPAGFRVSPARAYAIAHDSRRLSWKHRWQIYADSQFYYVHDTFLGTEAWRAYAYGLRIDGRTGEIRLRSSQ